jgi:hypothetical protein
MEKSICITCQKPKAQLNCGICHQSVCKYCAQFVDGKFFSFLKQVPEFLLHEVYCGPCFDEKVQPEVDKYNQIMEAAKNILVFSKTQGKETRLMSRKEPIVKVTDCADENEATLKLAFFAAQAHFNAIIDVDITFRKIKNGSYQYLLWNGEARPTNVK